MWAILALLLFVVFVGTPIVGLYWICTRFCVVSDLDRHEAAKQMLEREITFRYRPAIVEVTGELSTTEIQP